MPAVRRQRKEDREFKVILQDIGNPRAVWTTSFPISER
ncbi:rCG21142 [Rattus norvegicus]|uniref:RCG21142 n=1 Tax=Rattus norvegicus TaxID=10116 RepID=A6J0J1_RAT|nr:rCG21142 [Rattus norvegicus]